MRANRDCFSWLGWRLGRRAMLGAFSFLCVWQCGAQSIETLDLKPFVGPSPFDEIGAAHLLPRGRQVLDGVPFQFDGVVSLDGSGTGRTNLGAIAIGHAVDRVHLLAATHFGGAYVGALIAQVHLLYADQTTAGIDLQFGRQLRQWYSPWHRKADSISDTNAAPAWYALASDPARSDNVLRLYHIVLTNPFPNKPVVSLSVEGAKTGMGFLLAGISTGPAQAQRLPDTVPVLRRPIPDLTPRSGELASGQGVIKTTGGEAVAAR